MFELTFPIELLDLWVSFCLHERLNSTSLSLSVVESWNCFRLDWVVDMRLCTGCIRWKKAFSTTSVPWGSHTPRQCRTSLWRICHLAENASAFFQDWLAEEQSVVLLPYSLVIRAFSENGIASCDLNSNHFGLNFHVPFKETSLLYRRCIWIH